MVAHAMAPAAGSFMHPIINKIVILITAGYFLALGLAMPRHDWDMIAYVAAAYDEDGLKGPELSSTTYADIRQEVTSKKFSSLTEGNYRATVFNDPNSLEQQLPFYKIKIVYVELIRALKNFGISYPKATYVVSAFFASASICILAALSAEFGVYTLLVPFIAAFAGFDSLARGSSPDAIACFFALLATYSFARRSIFVYPLAGLMPLVRTDLIILSVLLMIFDFVRKKRFYPILAGIVGVTSYAAVNKLAGSYGYLTLFNFTFIGLDPYPRDMKLSHEFWLYLKPYLDCLPKLVSHRHAIVYPLLFYSLVIRKDYKILSSEMYAVTMIAVLYMLSHLALFPVYDERFFVFPVSILCVSLMRTLSASTFKVWALE